MTSKHATANAHDAGRAAPTKEEGYGLKMISETTGVRSTAPGIDQMILEKEKKDAEEEQARQELKRKRQRRGPMTAEERAARLAGMQVRNPHRTLRILT